MSNARTLSKIVVGTEIKIASVDSDLSNKIVSIKSRLDSDDSKIQSLDTALASVSASSGMADSDLKVVADLRNQLDSEMLFVRNLSLSYTNFLYNATAGQTSFSGSDANSLTLAYTAGSIQVFLNGVLLTAEDFTATDGTTIVLTEPVQVSAQLIIVCPKLESNYSSVVEPYDWANLTQQQKIVASDPANADQFGFNLDIKGDDLIVSSHAKASGDGAVYIITRSGTTWTQQQKITDTSAVGDADNFGRSVTIEGDYAIIGAPAFDPGSKAIAGMAQVWYRSGTTWSLQQEIVPASADHAASDRFGHHVDIDGTSALICASTKAGSSGQVGAVYVYTRSGSTWSQQAKLIPNETTSNGVYSASIKGDYAILGYMESESSKGAVYVFTRSGSSWTQQAKLSASDRASGDYFGTSVAINDGGDTAIVGTYLAEAAYVFTRSGSTWSQQQILTASDAASSSTFGIEVDIDAVGDTVIVGSSGADTGGVSNSGQTYMFTRSGSTWSEVKKFQASDSKAAHEFGRGVTIDDDTIVVGARSLGSTDSGKGQVYVYTAT